MANLPQAARKERRMAEKSSRWNVVLIAVLVPLGLSDGEECAHKAHASPNPL